MNLLSQIQMLEKSEYDYFALGASNIELENGIISFDKEFLNLPAGFVFHNLKDSKEIEIQKLLEYFKEKNSKFFRAYLPNCYESVIQQYKDFKITYEMGLVKSLEKLQESFFDTCSLRLIDTKSLWEVKKELYKLGTNAPDGHSLANGLYYNFEKKKYDIGYMKSYLYFFDDKPIATVSLNINGEFARLKNLYISPDFRKKGFSKDIVNKIANEAIKQKAKYLGVYAVEDSIIHKVYKSCGMTDVLRQIELYKEF